MSHRGQCNFDEKSASIGMPEELPLLHKNRHARNQHKAKLDYQSTQTTASILIQIKPERPTNINRHLDIPIDIYFSIFKFLTKAEAIDFRITCSILKIACDYLADNDTTFRVTLAENTLTRNKRLRTEKFNKLINQTQQTCLNFQSSGASNNIDPSIAETLGDIARSGLKDEKTTYLAVRIHADRIKSEDGKSGDLDHCTGYLCRHQRQCSVNLCTSFSLLSIGITTLPAGLLMLFISSVIECDYPFLTDAYKQHHKVPDYILTAESNCEQSVRGIANISYIFLAVSIATLLLSLINRLAGYYTDRNHFLNAYEPVRAHIEEIDELAEDDADDEEKRLWLKINNSAHYQESAENEYDEDALRHVRGMFN